MASEELVTEQFQFLGINVENEVLAKCVRLCDEYNVDAETFVEQWCAFSLNHLNGSPPTLEYLDQLERKEFSKRTAVADGNNASSAKTARTVTGTGFTVYGVETSNQPDIELLSNYISDDSKRHKVDVESVSVKNEICPATHSPKVGLTDKYSSRTNAGTIVHSFGDEKLLQEISNTNGPMDILNLNVTQVPNDDGDIYTKAMFGFELLHEKSTTFANHIHYMSQYIMKKAGLSDSTSVRHKTQTEVVVSGRIECDADARLNAKCVVLQGTWEESLSQVVPVDLDNLKQYSLFPGQVVVMKGVNPRGDKFIASQVYCDAALPIPDHRADLMNTLTGTLSMIVASGPYTTSENLLYEPLKDLITNISTYRPHIVILTGPFLDCEHAKVKENSMAETYRSFFERFMDSLCELNTLSPLTKIYIVSSAKDVFHVNVYPSPPYSCRRKPPNVHFIPDPCTLNINGILIGVTSTDVLMHISQEEIYNGISGDKLGRLASHVISQQCYYPLWPAPSSMSVDAALWNTHAQITKTPHILVLPSNFRYFVKEVNGCVVVNPEHVTKGSGGGTFARLRLSTSVDKSLAIAAQIVRI